MRLIYEQIRFSFENKLLQTALSVLRKFTVNKQILRAKGERIQEKAQKKLKLRYMCTWIRIQNIE
jgi:hypothetical protein